ncbi:MAG: hypothetical protein AAF713_01870 [Pseudomonadota bacterium]
MKPVLVTTSHRGVFAGLVADDADITPRTLALKGAMMCIKWRHRRGVMGLADKGPSKDCLIGAVADIPVLHDVTAVFDMTQEAYAAWLGKAPK